MSTKHYRNCQIKKKSDEEYEFFLRVDDERKGNIIVSVSPKGPADRAGLKNGDRIVEIEGKNVENLKHAEVVELIKKGGNEIMFQVVDEEHDPNNPAPKKNGDVKPTVSDLKPRLCHVTKKDNSFGFSIEAQGADKPGHFISSIADDGPAVKAGIRKGDRIIEVGGMNVEKLNHAKVVAQIKKKGSKVTLLVVDHETYKHFQKRKSKIKAKHASVSSDGANENAAKPGKAPKKSSKKSAPKSTSSLPSSQDEKARLVHVIKATGKGYGFFLRVKKDEKGEYIGDVKPGTPGDRCGLMEDDRVLSVNGKGILIKTHEEVVGIIKDNPNHVVLLVVGPKAIKNAKTNGLMSALRDSKEHIIEKPRRVKLTKQTGGYGFCLKMDMKNKSGHIFSDIDDNTPASQEGLKEGEVLGCVNGEDVTRIDHEKAVDLIRNAGGNVELVVGCAATMDLLRELEVELTYDLLDNWPSSDIFRMPDLSDAEDFFKVVATAAVVSAVAEKIADSRKNTIECTLTKVDNAFGFFLRDDSGHFLGNIEKDGSAERAGVKESDRIIEVNGVNVEKESHDNVVEMIKNSGDKVVFSILREEEESSAPTPEDEPAAPRPRYCVLERLPNGYGFNLNAEEGSRPGQYMKKIVAGGAASLAGVLEGDRVIEINDTNIIKNTHDDVVGIIKNSGSTFSVLVVDEEADLYYSKKRIEITKALATASEIHSSASSVVETEATVHVDPEEAPDKSSPPVIDIPPPPPYDEDEKEERVSELIEEAINEIRDDREAELDEIAQEIREEAAENIVEEFKEEVVEELKEEVVEELKEEVVEELKEVIQEEIRDTVQEEITEIVEDVKDEIKEEIKEEMMEEMKEEVMEELKEEIIEEMREEAKEEAREEFIEDIKENIADGIKTAVALAVVDEIKDAVEDRREDLKEEVVEEIRETPEEMRKRIEKEMREKMEREIKQKMEEELRQRIAAEAAAAAVLPPPPPESPEPTASVPVSVIASSFGREIRPQSSVKRAAQSFVPKADASEDLGQMVRNLRSVRRANEVHSNVNEEQNENSVNASRVKSARAMFEAGGTKQNSGPRPSWKRSSGTSMKPTGESNAPVVNGTDKPVTGRQTSWNKGGMSFKIVETSATFK